MSNAHATMQRSALRMIAIAAASGALGVALGAFGAHGLKSVLPQDLLAVFETGVRYQMYHTFALLACGILQAVYPQARFTAPAWMFLAGIVLFSGSLYALALTGIRPLGAITPLGGIAFLAGWLDLTRRVVRIGRRGLSPSEG